MLPYFDQPRLALGPLDIYAFGVLVAAAVLVGTSVLRRRALEQHLDAWAAQGLVTWVLVGGFVGAHLVDRLVYFPRETLSDPWSLLRIWQGLSSFGGFLGAVTGSALFLRRQELGRQPWSYLDAVAYAFPFGWVFGRLGCFVAFDHPGHETKFFLGQQYVDGVVRHNLGLDEALYTVVLAAIFFRLGRAPRPPGYFVGMLAVTYAPVRFGLDFLRKIDVRYLGLTPGQYGSLALLIAGLAILAGARRGAFAGS